MDRSLVAAFGVDIASEISYILDELISDANIESEIRHDTLVSEIHQSLCCYNQLPTMEDIMEEVDKHNYDILRELSYAQGILTGENNSPEEIIYMADMWYEECYPEYFENLWYYVFNMLVSLDLATIVNGTIVGDAQIPLVPEMSRFTSSQNLLGGYYYE